MGWVVNATPRPLYPQERPGTRCIGGWVGPRAGLDGCGKSRPNRDSTVLLYQFRSSGMLCGVSSDIIDVLKDRSASIFSIHLSNQEDTS